MKKLLAVLLLTLPLFAATGGEKEVLGAVEAWKQAALKGDAAALTKLFHDDLAYTHSNGMTQTKAQAVAAESSPTGIYKGVDMRDIVVRVHGDTALLEYKLDLTHF